MEELLAIAAMEGNVDVVEEAMLHELLIARPHRFLRAVKYHRLNLNTLTDEECRANFRFERNDLERLRNALGIPPYIQMRNRCSTTGMEGLCMFLRRLAYPNRLSDLEPLFGVSAEYISIVTNTVMNIIAETTVHLLTNLNTINWLNQNRMRYYANAIAEKAPLPNCWGFIDGTARGICRPTQQQQEYFSGHKRHHCVKYQAVLCPDGIIVSLIGPFPGRRHDAGMFRESGLYQQLQQCTVFGDEQYVLYGDPAYPLTDLLICPYAGRNLTEEQENFNTLMSTVRQSVEWGFGKVISEFAFLDYKKNQKLLLQDIANMYKTAVIITNCHTCLYGSQSSQYFHIEPPTLEDYLGV